jgi:CRISPR/Cas system-associated endoribonuclease Cas2
MTHLLIAYDLNKPGQDYRDLIQTIKSLGPTKRIQRSVWMANTKLTAQKVLRMLREVVDNNDLLLVIKLIRADYTTSIPEPKSEKDVRNLRRFISAYMRK